MEYLYLKWIDYRTDKKYLIGALFRDKEKGKSPHTPLKEKEERKRQKKLKLQVKQSRKYLVMRLSELL